MDVSWYVNPITQHYFDFNGVADRRTFWMFVLYNFILSIVIGIVAIMIHLYAISNLYALAVLLPALGLGVRRLHDSGKSGWWVLIAFVPILGWIYLIYLYCQPTTA